MYRVFVDGSVGTTGLRIAKRLEKRTDIELLCLDDTVRKDVSARRDALNASDVVFWCLPDDVAREAVSFIDNPHTVVIDTSVAHRTADDWIYGFAELNNNQRSLIASAKRIANPGCHATGFISLVAPLVACGIIAADTELTAFSLTGYSGGGKKMIAQYETEKDALLEAPRMYGLAQKHKHLPEMQKYCNLEKAPVFMPVVSDFYSGMEVIVPLFRSQINGDINDIYRRYRCAYNSKVVRLVENADENGFVSAAAMSGRDDLQIAVYGNNERILLVARFDNLGKGASGAAIQNMNIVLGLEETTGLKISGGEK